MARLTSILALICLLLTLLWLGLLIADMATAGPLRTFEQVAAHAGHLGWIYYVTYINAALITLTATAFFAALYSTLQPTSPPWLIVGLVFTPVYAVLNLVVYLSQIAVVPALLALRADAAAGAAADVLLRQVLQTWPASGMAFFNGLAYAILAFPSILFGAILWQRGRVLRWSGLLFILNGIACILGVIGSLTGNSLLGLGTLVGGVLFLLALAFLVWGSLRQEQLTLGDE